MREVGKKLKLTRLPEHQKPVTLPNLQTVTKCVMEPMEIEGRRIVNIKFLAQELNCKSCETVLSLKNIISEIIFGLGSQFIIQCHNCLRCKEVYTDKRHESIDGAKHFDVNTKAVIGKYIILLKCFH